MAKLPDNVLKISSYGTTSSAKGGVWDTNFNMHPDSKALATAKNAALAALGPMTPAKAAKLRGKDMYLKTASGVLMETSLGNVALFTGTDKAKAEFKEAALRRAAIDDYIAYVDTKASTSRTKQKAIPPNSTIKCPLNDCSEASFQLGAQWDIKYGTSATSWNNDQFKYTDPVKFRKEIVNGTARASSGPTPASQTAVLMGQPTQPPTVSEAKLKLADNRRLTAAQMASDEKDNNRIAEEIIRTRRREYQAVSSSQYAYCITPESGFTVTQCDDMQRRLVPEGAPISPKDIEIEKSKSSFPAVKFNGQLVLKQIDAAAKARAGVAKSKPGRKSASRAVSKLKKNNRR